MNDEKNKEIEEEIVIDGGQENQLKDDISFEDVNDERSRSEERRRNPKLASEGSRDSSDDISFETTDDEESNHITIKKLREKIKKLESEKQEYLDMSQRAKADYINFKKEVDTNRVMERKFATKRFIEDLLPVLDSYDMAQGNKEAWEKVDQNWRIGIEYIFGQLRTVLENEGVTQFGKVGETFNPELHESMETVNVENQGDNDKIMKVLQNGYKMNDSILRPARVHTGHYEKNN